MGRAEDYLSGFRPAMVPCLSGFCPARVRHRLLNVVIELRSVGVGVERKFQSILDTVAERAGRSRLEPYAELIDELRLRGQTYRNIAAILKEKCQLQVSKSAINDFVRVRSRRKRSSAGRIASSAMIAAPIAPEATSVDCAQKPDGNEVRRRIAALKARETVTTPARDDFHYDPSQPLRLIAPEKPRSGE